MNAVAMAAERDGREKEGNGVWGEGENSSEINGL